MYSLILANMGSEEGRFLGFPLDGNWKVIYTKVRKKEIKSDYRTRLQGITQTGSQHTNIVLYTF